MSVKITIRQASIRYGVNERTIQRWVKRYEVHKFSDDTYDLAQLDALVENYGRADYLQVNWGKAACEGLPTEMFYKIEEKNVRKIVDMKIFIGCRVANFFGINFIQPIFFGNVRTHIFV